MPDDDQASFSALQPFTPAPGLRGPHAQTYLGSLLRSRRPVGQAEVWRAPDGEPLDIVRVPAQPTAPHVFVLHGLEGSARAGYVREVMRMAQAVGWGAVGLSFRSCGPSRQRSLRSYSAVETADPLFVLARMRGELGITGPLLGVGFSLGAAVLLRLALAPPRETGLCAAAAVSAPFDLAAGIEALDGSADPLTASYRRFFLRTLRRKALVTARAYPEILDAREIGSARTIRAFDQAVTARVYGFPSAEAYYEDGSCGPKLSRLALPTLLVSSRDDPMVPGATLPRSGESPLVTTLFTEQGGHVGFVAGSLLRPIFWAEAQVRAFFQGVLRQGVLQDTAQDVK